MSNVNTMVIQSLSETGIPVTAEKSKDDAKPYITFNCSDDRGIEYCDDAPECDDITMQIHLFTDVGYDYINIKKQIRSALFGAGFSYPVITELHEDDYNHIIFECKIALGRED